VRDNHIKMLERWNSANPTKSDKSQWSVTIRGRNATMVFHIILPDEFPEVAPIFRFQTPVDHPWVDSHDGVTILNDSLLQWNPHCDITRIGKNCVHEFALNPPKIKSKRPGGGNINTGSRNEVSIIYRKKPFGLKLKPKIKLQVKGAIIHSFEHFHEPNGLEVGMCLVTLGQRPVENMNFKNIIKLLGEVSVPVQLVFRRATSAAQPKPVPRAVTTSYGHGMGVYQQSARPAPVSFSKAARAVTGPAVSSTAQYQKPRKPQIPAKKNISLPKISDSTFRILEKYNIDELQELLSYDLAIEQLAIDVADKDLNRMRKKLRDETKAAANMNLSYKDVMEISKTALEELRKEVSELRSKNRTLFAERQRLAPKIDKSQVKKAFVEAAEKEDEESQEILDKFESDDIAYVTFIKKYKASREIHHKYQITKGLVF